MSESEETRWYVPIFKDILTNPKISAQARLLYAILSSYLGPGCSKPFPGLKRLSFEMGCGRDTVQRYLRELEKFNLIERRQSQKNGKFQSTEYTILDSPKMDFPTTVSPTTEQPTTVLSATKEIHGGRKNIREVTPLKRKGFSMKTRKSDGNDNRIEPLPPSRSYTPPTNHEDEWLPGERQLVGKITYPDPSNPYVYIDHSSNL